MTYQSVDQLQKVLAEKVFHYTQDSKKASGRALGTLVEIITFYLLKSWGFENSVAIERPLAEYGNPDITHNVEYSLHPILRQYELSLPANLPVTSTRLLKAIEDVFSSEGFEKYSNTLLTSNMILRNSCILAKRDNPYPSHLSANLVSVSPSDFAVTILEQYSKPYAMFECKRVGVEEGMRKGPQTIEKAKQGAYVAKAVSSLYKVRLPSGELRGLIYNSDNEIYSKPYTELIAEIVGSDKRDLLKDFILTVGVVSNHGNWFTSDNHNKELKVLAQSYDWLIFLTDAGLAEFITELLLEPKPLLEPARNAFLASYTSEKKKNFFTKVQMDYEADQVLQTYFRDNVKRIEKWFNIIAPRGGTIRDIHSQISQLRDKNWKQVHSL
jgi:hypothetical protein